MLFDLGMFYCSGFDLPYELRAMGTGETLARFKFSGDMLIAARQRAADTMQTLDPEVYVIV